MDKQQLKEALAWQMAIGADAALLDKPAGMTPFTPMSAFLSPPTQKTAPAAKPAAPTPALSASLSAAPKPAETPPSDHQGQQIFAAPPQTAQPSQQPDLSQITSLADLKAALLAFEGCALKHTASNLVFADGNPEARIMLIGEAPGRDEDRTGLPFVGAAGQLLDKMLASIGLDRTNVYICNILPWRPPGNRTPTAEETTLLWPFLRRHIQLKAPEIIFALGGSSAKLLLEETTGILKLRGQIRHCDFGLDAPVPVLPSLHPAYLLRSPGQKRLSYQDLLQLQKFLAGS